MKTLFTVRGKSIYIADKEKMVFKMEGEFLDVEGNVFTPEDSSIYDLNTWEKDWEWYWLEYEGLSEPLISESVIEPIEEIDEIFGQYGFKNKNGDFVIRPQYAYAHEFTNGLAAVNLNRTWYRHESGREYYENHFGYIDEKGKTVIPFKYDEAYPFNEFGVAVVSEIDTGWYLIDKRGEEIPGTRFDYIDCYYEYDQRFLEFDSIEEGESLVGLYDTKERKILLDPFASCIREHDHNCLKITEDIIRNNISESFQYFMDSEGKVKHPWLYNEKFALVDILDKNEVTAVARYVYTETTKTSGTFEIEGKTYERRFIYGLYSSKGKFLLPLEYDDIEKLSDNMWACFKDGIITVVQTEETD